MVDRHDRAIYTSYFDRDRDWLIVIGDPGPVHRDHDLHLLAHGRKLDPLVLQLLRDGLSAIALYVVSRPRFDSCAWTINIQEPAMNLFFSGSTRDDSVIGRAFLENVQSRERNLFHAEISRPRSELQRSSVEVDGLDIFGMVEQYCATSDQQPVRFFHEAEGEGERVGLVQAFAGADLESFGRVEGTDVFDAADRAVVKPLVRRGIAFRCGCDLERILDVVVPIYGEDLDALFEGDPAVYAECPRCGAAYTLDRSVYEEALRKRR